MKKVLALLVLVPSMASASPYFRLNNPFDHPVSVQGALIGIDPSQSEAAVLYPIVTHSPKDGCLISEICEDWTPLAIGGGMIAGKVSFEVAPLFNVLPWMQRAAASLIPDKFASVKSLLTPSVGCPVTFSIGPTWEYQQSTNKGYYRTFTGLALQW
jgi:hypothetical protein